MVPLRHTALVPVLAAAAWLAAAGQGLAEDYSCGSIYSGHCYGVTRWKEQPEYFGALTDIRLSPTVCTGCDGFVTNELWVVDNISAPCVANPIHKCFTEAGYFMWNALGQDTYFFWADFSSDGQRRVTYSGRATPWSQNHFMIVKDARAESPGPFILFMYNDSLSTLYSAQSLSYTANSVIVGTELTGTHGIFVADTPFMGNIWAVQPLGPEYIFWYEPQVTPGMVREDIPPRARWNILPGDPLGPLGGEFSTSTY